LKHGFHNVSRWMTWLPISLKNAAKCDKWYQLQNHSITESLNANGAREKLSTAYPVHAVFSVSNKNPTSQKSLGLSGRSNSLWRSSGYPESPSQRRFMGNILSCAWVLVAGPPCAIPRNNKRINTVFGILQLFCYRPECGRITRRT
jgi:hypothetical protein